MKKYRVVRVNTIMYFLMNDIKSKIVFFMYFFFKQQCINETISKRYHKELSLKFRIMIKQKKNERSKLFNNNSLSDMVEFGFELENE